MTNKEDIKDWQGVIGAKRDGDFGPKTIAATIQWARDRNIIGSTLSPERHKVLLAAWGEVGGTNRQDTYWREVCPELVGSNKAWCGGFVLWCLRQAGITERMWTPGIGFIYNYTPRLQIVTHPQPGDIAYYDKPSQHYALVESYDGGKLISTIDGNQPGESVRHKSNRPLSEATAYYSIEKLITRGE